MFDFGRKFTQSGQFFFFKFLYKMFFFEPKEGYF